jgi:hypothetical protein
VVKIHLVRPFLSITYAALFCCRLGPCGSNIGLGSLTSATLHSGNSEWMCWDGMFSASWNAQSSLSPNPQVHRLLEERKPNERLQATSSPSCASAEKRDPISRTRPVTFECLKLSFDQPF